MILITFFRRLGNRSLDALFVPPLDTLFSRQFRGNVVCLLYHRVANPGVEPFLDRFGTPPIPPDELDRELRLLANWGARFMTVDELLRGVWPAAEEIGVVVTFDDGFRDTYENGLPVVEAAGARATVFQASAMLAERQTLIWEHELYRIGNREEGLQALVQALRDEAGVDYNVTARSIVQTLRDAANHELVAAVLNRARRGTTDDDEDRALARRIYPSSAMIRAAQARGHEIGSHGRYHLRRSSISADLFAKEVMASRTDLAEICGQFPRCFSYPFNSYQSGDDAVVAKYFDAVFTVDGGPLRQLITPIGIPRFTWPGPHANALRRRRWLRTGHI